ncbi:uncharacterized protein [Parasteatoda tepidariorum]|uniref:uncharacterized protein n=1 Tax=Parasteatoda tepidariorum TaxID=114398 RepID=UPI001C725563|nr:uncharacterized protein LOC107456207 [Parasteatoda tepidariorum]XP_015929494.2 uncharacterized protein LOC107456207 [Parasteatoda tepidariorum]XP_015929495.2 uncharacterized protein LOC107456207 [Parasteatoda tepidariorum]XP_042905683.1 uncharacterized protein LOC107456207 [Parasteatoda tepidariorum]XP_042905684.1 uncharacterized protein LOC107456207 [Parasteatoda tepidariorum]XP_042905685.1 uncharacterized protein LOC107456207 [Parasteatoda tepidariorum]
MAFISLRNRNQCALLLLFCLAIYFLFSWFIIGKSSQILNDATDIKRRSDIQNIHNIEQIHIEDEAFIHKDQLLITLNYETSLANFNKYDNFISKRNKQPFMRARIDPKKAFNGIDGLLASQKRVSTVSPTHHPQIEMKPDNIEEDVYLKTGLNTVSPTYSPDLELQPDNIESAVSLKTPSLSEEQLNSDDISEFNTKNQYNSTENLTRHFIATNHTKNPAFIIDTMGCRIPKLDPWDPTIVQFIELLDPLICSNRPSFMTPEPNGVVHLNESVLQKYYNSAPGDMECLYQEVRLNSTTSMIREDTIYLMNQKPLVFNTPIDAEHIAAICYFNNSNTHEQYMPLTRLKAKVEEKKSKLIPSSHLNVILYGIDSISKLNFFRHFRQTKAFLKDKMNIFDMKGYTKVADNTFPNLVPMLTGYFVDYFWNESIADTFFFDNMNLIWKDYSRQGYRTFFAEDAPFNGIFNYYKRGFLEQPTDYYYRPLALMIEKSVVRHEAKKYNSTCLNSDLEMDLINDYLKNFVKTMGSRPYFAFVMHSTLTHDLVNYASYTDFPTVKLLKALDEHGSLNNTLLIMFSDHGIRYGDLRFTYIGKFEERMPFMYIHIPKWFLKQHPDIERNFFVNQDRLITLFDIHATLKHLLHLDQDFMEDKDEYGLSLFNEIPETRTCEDAEILQHWCPCTSFDPVPLNNLTVVNAAEEIVKHINKMLLPYADVCRTLEVKEITDALRGLPNDIVLKFIGQEGVVENARIAIGQAPPTLGDYLITLRTQPGDAMFEGTVRYDEENNITSVLDISRINMYGKQSWCIDSPRLKLYCYCKTQLK